jgi:hypothetical protein
MSHAGAAIAPSVITTAAALGGVVITGGFSLIVMGIRNRREDRNRFVDAIRLAYIELFAVLDYWPGSASERATLKSERDAGTLTDAAYEARRLGLDERDHVASERAILRLPRSTYWRRRTFAI